MSDYDRWAADYDLAASEMTEDVQFYVELAQEADGPVVELAVGTGRVAIPVAEAIGRPVLGIDSSPAMLEIGRRRVGEAGVDVELLQGDMRDLELPEPAALIYCPFRALLHLPTWADRRRVFERVAASLRPGGRFAWNVWVFSPFVAARNHDRRQERVGGRFWEIAHHVPADNRIDIVRGAGERENGPLTLWWTTRSEWEGLLDVSGLETEALYGWFDRRPFDDDAVEMVWVARKPA